jgi:adenylate cyclase
MKTSESAGESMTGVKLPRILVVDDVPDNLLLVHGLFEDRYDVVQADSGRAALQVVMSDDPPDMVLLDIMMPDMDGYEVLRRIRTHPPTANIPVIFLSALAGALDERLGMDLGAIDYLTKPIDPERVVERVEAHVRATAHARRVDSLSEKLARHLSPERWQTLFRGADAGTIRFMQKVQTVLYAEAGELRVWSDHERDSFTAEVEWLATRHHGVVDPFVDGAAAIFFDEPSHCIRMAMDLQRSASDLHLRMGVHTGICDVAGFRSGLETHCTFIGHEIWKAAKGAAAAATGSIVVSPETYALVKNDMESDSGSCLLMEEFHNSDLARISLTPAPRPGNAAMSTFAGLGQF